MCGNADLIFVPLWQKVDDTGIFDLLTVFAEVTLGFEAPVQRADDPILQPLDVHLDLSVDLLVPKVGDALDVGDEGIDSVLAELSNHVNRFLEVHPVMLHENRDEVMSIVAAGLLDVVGEDVLKTKG